MMNVQHEIIQDLVGSLQQIDEPTYPLRFAIVTGIDANISQQDHFPRCDIIDNGEEKIEVDVDPDGNRRSVWALYVRVGHKGSNKDDVQETTFKAEQAVRQWLRTKPSVTNGLDVRLDDVVERGWVQHSTVWFGFSVLKILVRYYETGTAQTGTDVSGTAFIDTVRDKLKTLMDALVTAQASYNPKLSYAYDRHDVARLHTDAVSIDLQSADSVNVGVANDAWDQWSLVFSFRIHVGYAGDAVDSRKVLRLAQGIINKLMTNLDLGDQDMIKEIENITGVQSFSESETVGGEILVLITSQSDWEQA